MKSQNCFGRFGVFLLLSLFLFCTPQFTSAQTRSFLEHGRMVHQYGFGDGLKLPFLGKIIEGKDGYIWSISHIYLTRYDGYQFKSYPLPKVLIDENDLPLFSNLLEDKDGKIWLTSLRNVEVWKFDPISEDFEKYMLLPHKKKKGNRSAQLVQGKGNNLLLGGEQGLFQFKGSDTTSITHYSFEYLQEIFQLNKDSFPFSIAPYSTFVPFKDSQGEYWGGTSHGLFFKMNFRDQAINFNLLDDESNNKNRHRWDNLIKIIEYSENYFVLLGYRIEDNKGHYFIGRLNKHNGSFKEINTGLSPTIRINDIYKDSNNILWIGTDKDGLYTIDYLSLIDSKKEKPSLVRYFFDIEKTRNPIAMVETIAEDRFGNIWIGSGYNFLYRIDAKKEPLQFTNFLNYPNFKIGNNINGFIYEDSQNNVWVSSEGNGVVKYNTKSNQLTHFQKEFKGIPIKQFGAIFEYADRSMLFGGIPECLVKYHPDTDKAVKIKLDFLENQEIIYQAIEFEDNLLVLLGFDGSGFVVNKNNLAFLYELPYHFAAKKGIGNTLWISDLRRRIDPLIKYKVTKEGLDTLRKVNKGGLAFLETDKTGVWLSGWQGLRNIRFGDTVVDFYNEEDGVINNSVGEVFEHDGFLWIFTIKGVSRLDIKNKTIKNFNQLNHIAKLQGNNLVIQNKEGAFRISGVNGFYTFHPDSLYENRIPPIINIQELTIRDEKLSAEKKHTAFQLGFIELNYLQNDIAIDYVGLNFKNTVKNQYQYLLEGHQKDWHNVGNDQTARFSNLPPGNYTFKVKAANADGIWSKPKSLKITILPPWWQTWWAYLVYSSLIIGLLAYWYRSLQQKLKKEQTHNQELQILNSELADINTANQRFVPNDFLQILGKKSIKDLKLGDQVATKMTVLFSDIRDYTPLSESMTPEENFKFINAYLGRVGPIIKQHGGFISSYLGDGLMALFVNKPENAIAATIAMQKELDNYNRERQMKGLRVLKTGMGLNTGDLMLGVIGDEYRYESTVISDAVNTASRMEGLTKVFGAAIIMSERTLAGLRGDFPSPRKLNSLSHKSEGDRKSPPDQHFAYRYLGKVKVKGKDKALKIYDLYEGETVMIRQLKAQTHLQFEAGLDHYYRRKFGKAAACFKQVLAVNESDKAAEYYLEKSVHFIVNGVAEDWSGVEEMAMK